MSSPLVVIVGAGISGLACASFLAQNGISELKIVDAKDRLGGRISTVRPEENFFFEAGAQWIHGAIGNPVKEFADEYSIKTIVEEEKKHFYFENQERCQDDDQLSSLNKAEETFNSILQLAEEQGGGNEKHQNVLSFIEQAWNEKYQNDKSANKLFNVLLNLQNIIEGCNSLHDVDLLSYDQYVYCPGGDQSVTGGLDQILNKLSLDIPPSSVLLKRMVWKIDWKCCSKQRKVNVHMFDISNKKDEVLQADYVVVTIPLGVLKSNHQTLFDPPLPLCKANAIHSLGFGNVTKIILRFDKKLWDEQPVTMHLLRDEPCQFGHYSALITKCHANDEYFLTLWLSGEEGARAERLNEDDLKKNLTEDLRKFIPSIPPPKSVYVTKWRSDPYTRGAYTFMAVGSSPHDIALMAQPLSVDGESKPKVLFAGEATHSTFYSTMHGAYQSGIREGKRIKNLLLGQKN